MENIKIDINNFPEDRVVYLMIDESVFYESGVEDPKNRFAVSRTNELLFRSKQSQSYLSVSQLEKLFKKNKLSFGGYIEKLENTSGIGLDFFTKEMRALEEFSSISVAWLGRRAYLSVKTNLFELCQEILLSCGKNTTFFITSAEGNKAVTLSEEEQRLVSRSILSVSATELIKHIAFEKKSAEDITTKGQYSSVYNKAYYLTDIVPIGPWYLGYSNYLTDRKYLESVRFASKAHPLFDTILALDLIGVRSYNKVAETNDPIVMSSRSSVMNFTTVKRFNQAFNINISGIEFKDSMFSILKLYLGKFYTGLMSVQRVMVKIEGIPEEMEAYDTETKSVVKINLPEALIVEDFNKFNNRFLSTSGMSGALESIYNRDNSTDVFMKGIKLDTISKNLMTESTVDKFVLSRFELMENPVFNYNIIKEVVS